MSGKTSGMFQSFSTFIIKVFMRVSSLSFFTMKVLNLSRLDFHVWPHEQLTDHFGQMLKLLFDLSVLHSRGRSRLRFQCAVILWLWGKRIFTGENKLVCFHQRCSLCPLEWRPVLSYEVCSRSLASLPVLFWWAYSLCLCLARWRVCSCAPSCSLITFCINCLGVAWSFQSVFSCDLWVSAFLLSNSSNFVLLWVISIKTLILSAASSTGQVSAAQHWL